jgi:hypothetical protein
MNLDQSAAIINGITIDSALLLVLKLFFLVGGLLYFVFGLVVIRQIAIMKKTLTTPLSATITLLGYAHLAATIAAIAFFLMIL